MNRRKSYSVLPKIKLDAAVGKHQRAAERFRRPSGKHPCNAFNIWALGITTVFGGFVFSWNNGLSGGFGCFFIATLIIGTAYSALIFCSSEMTSALPFAGGTYGLARCTLGFFPGFLVGCFESFSSITYASLAALILGSMVCQFCSVDKTFQPLFWFIFYSTSLSLQIFGDKLFWKFTNIFGVFSLFSILVYVFGAVKFTDFPTFALAGSPVFVGAKFSEFMNILPFPALFFIGIEFLPLSCDMFEKTDPRKVIPYGSICCVFTIFIASILVLFVCSSLSPGIKQTSTEVFPLSFGFSLFFGCSTSIATVLSIPAIFATGYGFIFVSGKLLYSLASSGLLPQWLLHKHKSTDSPASALLFGSVLSYALCCLIFFAVDISRYLFQVSFFSACATYCSHCYAYIYLKIKQKKLQRLFISPLNIYGALYSASVFTLGAIASVGFQEDGFIGLISIIVTGVLMSIYYFTVAKNRQTFSPAEQKILHIGLGVNYTIQLAHERQKRKRSSRIYPVRERRASLTRGTNKTKSLHNFHVECSRD